MARFTTRHFTHDRVHKVFIAEISDLEANAGCGDAFHQVYPDACDEGLTLISERTGRESDWAMAVTHHNREGEQTHWTLVPTPQTLRRLPELKGYKMTVFND